MCTFLARGELGKVLQDQGIDVVGPFSASLYWFRHILRRIARRMSSLLWVPVAGKLYALRRVVRRIAQPMRPLLKPAAGMLRQLVRICRQPLRAFYSLRAVVYLSEVVRLAVRRMLPKGPLGRQMLKKLKVYAGPTHPHQAQQPVARPLPERSKARTS